MEKCRGATFGCGVPGVVSVFTRQCRRPSAINGDGFIHTLLHGVWRCFSRQPGGWEMSEESRGTWETPFAACFSWEDRGSTGPSWELAPHSLGCPEWARPCACWAPASLPSWGWGFGKSSLFFIPTGSREPRPRANNEKVNGRSRDGKAFCWCRTDHNLSLYCALLVAVLLKDGCR